MTLAGCLRGGGPARRGCLAASDAMCPQASDKRIAQVAAMGRQDLIDTILAMECSFPVDFTEEYLRGLSIERLRHIWLALYTKGKVGGGPGGRGGPARESAPAPRGR